MLLAFVWVQIRAINWMQRTQTWKKHCCHTLALYCVSSYHLSMLESTSTCSQSAVAECKGRRHGKNTFMWRHYQCASEMRFSCYSIGNWQAMYRCHFRLRFCLTQCTSIFKIRLCLLNLVQNNWFVPVLLFGDTLISRRLRISDNLKAFHKFLTDCTCLRENGCLNGNLGTNDSLIL